MLFPKIVSNSPALLLAPMEGVTDYPMRKLLTERGGFSFCVGEFLRISQEVPPIRVFSEHLPELTHGAKTDSGVPVQLQLLGGNPERMAMSAHRAIQAGATAIDINFGCPAPTVNRHDGGASLLKYPSRIYEITKSVRQAVPSHIPVSAKLRLGWDSMEDIFLNAEQAQLAGASWITIHARTKVQGYAPPAYWSYIGEIKRSLTIPVVANGDIWTVDDFLRCQEETGCLHFMIGRGALADPSLPAQVARQLGLTQSVTDFNHHPHEWLKILSRFASITQVFAPGTQYTARRIKQWLNFAQMRRPAPWIENVKRAPNLDAIFEILSSNPN